MRRDVERYVRNCHSCQRSRTSRHFPFDVLRPLSIPEGPWKDISMDFVTELLWSNECDAILAVICRLTKMRHFIPCQETISTNQLAGLFVRHVFRLHDLPDSIVSDREGQFIAEFWKQLCQLFRVQRALSTSYHPKIDDQTERFNVIMEQYLRVYTNYLQND